MEEMKKNKREEPGERDVSAKCQGGKFHYLLLKESHIIQVRAAESPCTAGLRVLRALLNLNGLLTGSRRCRERGIKGNKKRGHTRLK